MMNWLFYKARFQRLRGFTYHERHFFIMVIIIKSLLSKIIITSSVAVVLCYENSVMCFDELDVCLVCVEMCTFKEKTYSPGDSWHPYLEPFGFMFCVRCACAEVCTVLCSQ